MSLRGRSSAVSTRAISKMAATDALSSLVPGDVVGVS